MFETHDPIVGTWFVNQTGKLLKVRMLIFSDKKLQRVLVQYLDGTTHSVKVDDWFCLKLNKQIHQAGLSMQLH